MRSFTRRLLAFSILVAVALSAARGAVITFEDLSPGGPGGAGAPVVVTNQYASLGVTFNFPDAFDYSKGLFAIPNFAHSGTVAIEQCYAAEFCTSPISINFTAGQARVKVWVGYSAKLDQSIPVIMRGFDANGTEIVSSTVTLPANPNNPTLIRTPLEVGRFAGDIRRVDISFFSSGGNIYFNNGLAVDDVEFDTIGPPPPCPAANPPTVSLLKPASGLVTRCNRFLFQDAASSADPFARRTITVTGSTMGQRTTWTTQVAGGGGGPTWIYDALFPGLNTVTDRVEDCAGFSERSATVTYDPIPVGTRVVVLGFEPTQSVQTMPNSVPLIADKRTVVRVYLSLEGPLTSLPGISGRMTANPPGPDPSFQLGAAIPPFNVQSLNTVTVLPGTDLVAARRNINLSLNFEVPASWTEVGKVHFGLTGISLDGCDTNIELVGGQNLNDLSLYSYNTFTPAPPVRVRIVSVPYQTTSGGTVHSPRQKDLDFLQSWLRRAYPTPMVSASFLTLDTRTGTPGSSFSADDINSQLQDVRSMEVSSGSVDSHTHYYGMVDDAGGFMRGKADGIPSWVASGPTGSGTFGWDGDGSYGDWYGGHELGHTFGRFHARYCGAEECFDFIWTFCPDGYVPYPYAGGFLSSNVVYGNFGFDVGDPSLSLPMAVFRPDVAHDVMTYCDNEWVSDFTYEGILDRLRAENPSGGARAKRVVVADALLVSAKMNLTQETAQLRPFWRLPNLDATERPAVSHYSIQLRGAADQTLATYLFAPKVDSEAVAGEDFKASMSEVVPWVAGTRRIVIMRDAIEMASRTVTPNAPTVQMLSPNGGENLTGASAVVSWQGNDADGQPLTYALHYSRNNGHTWQVVDTGLTTTSATVNLDHLPGSSNALFRIIATDGVNTTMDDSNAVFTVRSKPPTAGIIGPANNAAYTSADTVVFTGSATDVEDGDLTGSALQWTSSIQGALGSGASASASLLPGTHVITLTATDSDGGKGTASITLVVTAAAPMANPGRNRYAIVGAPVALDGTGSSGVPALSFQWEFVSRPNDSAASLTGDGSATPSFTPDRPGAYVLQLTIKDATGTSAMAQVTIIATSAVSALRIAGGLAGSTPADMTLANVELSGASVDHIDILDAVRLARRALLSREGSGVVTVTAQNQYGSIVVGRGYGVYINDERLNGSPDQRILACHQFIGAYNAQMGVWYDGSRWIAYNENRSTLQLGEKVNYTFGPSLGAATRSSAGGPFPWGVYLDDPRINFNPNAIVLSSHNFVASYGAPLGLWFSGSKWTAYNETGATVPDAERYFWADASASGGRVVRSASTAYSTYGVYINDARINGNSGAIVLVQHDGQSSYNTSPVGVWFDGSRWVAYNEDRSPLADGEAINYMVAN
ncbi:MAG TPA: hypothetical protein VGM37_19630 [Armatimonadota bacterium]|jgi:hypothetical protein